MIASFKDQDTEKLWHGESVRRLNGIRRPALMRLGRLHAAISLDDLAGLRGNRLERLKREREGQWSIRINDQWRICFRWPDGEPGPSDVEIVGYH